MRLCARLARLPGVRLVLAGRNVAKLAQLRDDLLHNNPDATLESVTLDITEPDFAATLLKIQPDLVLHLAGPFQEQDYSVARACITAGCNYIDMADGREFVRGFLALDAAARERSVSLITGASTVPGFSAALIDAFAPRFTVLEKLTYGISAGLKTGLGRATLQAVLSYCGKSYDVLHDGRMQTIHGLGHPRHHTYPPPVGRRALVDCDIPDHALFPTRYPTLRTMNFGSCIDAAGLAKILDLMRWGVMHEWVCDWNFLGGCIMPFMRVMKIFGSRDSGFFMHMDGIGHDGAPLRLTCEIGAADSSGLEIPVTPVMLLVKRWLHDGGFPHGAYPCLDLFTLRDFAAELADYPIRWYVNQTLRQGSDLL